MGNFENPCLYLAGAGGRVAGGVIANGGDGEDERGECRRSAENRRGFPSGTQQQRLQSGRSYVGWPFVGEIAHEKRARYPRV